MRGVYLKVVTNGVLFGGGHGEPDASLGLGEEGPRVEPKRLLGLGAQGHLERVQDHRQPHLRLHLSKPLPCEHSLN